MRDTTFKSFPWQPERKQSFHFGLKGNSKAEQLRVVGGSPWKPPEAIKAKMSENNGDEQIREEDATPDYTKYDEDSVPIEERPIKKTHEGRPDLDYDDTPVGPAPEGDANDSQQNDN
ncbi:unnamed protein product [Caenorhabditis auriculariae]|uniref:Uncharacterized protein n=1 Tax=Caenorhabditis auriculariae TaxID=2777116 RepID=A0A8S1HS05_9PELO|nr:unnamed protein product [Caenorhabditis auriculariae]